MLESFLIAFTTLFATIGSLDVAALFAALTVRFDPATRRAMALRGVLVASGILLAFALLGEGLLGLLGISLPALRAAGGILLLLIGLDMVFARSSGGRWTTEDENREAATRSDLAVFPLATPLIAGPGAIGAVILLMADAGGDLVHQGLVMLALLLNLFLTLILLWGAGMIQRLLGLTGIQVLSRVVGILLCALAMQFLFDGIRQSGLFEPVVEQLAGAASAHGVLLPFNPLSQPLP